MATAQKASMRYLWPTALLLILAWGVAAENNTTDFEDVDLLPSDVPVTMMDRLNNAKVLQVWDTVERSTLQGRITGLREPTLPPQHTNTHMDAFRGIPYAKAPVGSLRFSDPIDFVDEWPGRYLNATKYKSFCPQYDVDSKSVLGSENCLFLNVYTPSVSDTNERHEKRLHPVFVFIHGGAYLRGSSSAHGAEKLLTRNVVVVTLNYRLGAFGYLSTGDSILPGNYGLLDQVSALRWVQRNIAHFGGDPNQVTIGGFSAGAASVHGLMLSPLAKNLFHGGIMMSGTAFCPWALRPDPLTPARLLAEKLGCPTMSSSALATCVSSKSVNQIVTAQASIYKFEFYPMWFAPVVDGGLRASPFFPLPLHELPHHPTPTIIGMVPDEGLLFAAGVALRAKQPSNASAVYDEAARYIFSPWPYPEVEEAMKDVAEALYYSKHARTSFGTLLEEITEVITDYEFTSCFSDAATAIAKSGAPVYSYLMTHREPETPTWAIPLYEKLKTLGYETPLLDEGVSHGDDLVHLFAFPYALGQGSNRDQKVTQIILSMFTNFITNGLPQENLDQFQLGDLSKWLPLEPDQPVGFYNISVNPSMVYKPYRSKERNFWQNVVPRPGSSKSWRNIETQVEISEPGLQESVMAVSSLMTESCPSSSPENYPQL